jgi:hypothetical protein
MLWMGREPKSGRPRPDLLRERLDDMIVRVTAMSQTFDVVELGLLSAEQAISMFTGRDWAKDLTEADALEADGTDCATPDMTLTALPSHMIIEAVAPQSFNVEICIPREKRFLGFIRRVKFYTFRDVPPGLVQTLIEIFCGDFVPLKHATLAGLVA